MTKEEAIMVLKNEQPHCGKKALFSEGKKYEAYDVAIKALEQEPILDKIRADIMQLDYDTDYVDYDYNDMAQTETIHTICREEVLHIIAKYKADLQSAFDCGVASVKPCEDCISRQAVLDAITANCIWENEYNLTSSRIKKVVENLPSVTLQPMETKNDERFNQSEVWEIDSKKITWNK